MDAKIFKTIIGGREVTVETGKYAGQANGSCFIRCGDTVVMVNVTMSETPRPGMDFFPLSVDYEEKMYAMGKIPGGFKKREGRASDKAILTSRLIDRPLRPLFPKGIFNDVCVIATALSVDTNIPPEVYAMLGSSIALSISDIPWNGPVSSVFAGYVDGEIVINPTAKQRETSSLELTVASSSKKVVMIEAGGKEIPEDLMFDAIMKAHEVNKQMVEFIEHVKSEVGKEKFSYPSCEVDHDLYDLVYYHQRRHKNRHPCAARHTYCSHLSRSDTICSSALWPRPKGLHEELTSNALSESACR